MRLGLSQSSYRWVSYPGLRIDLPHYGFRGTPHPYGTTTVGPVGLEDNIDWWLERCEEWRFAALCLADVWIKSASHARQVGKKCAAKGVEWIGALDGSLSLDSKEWPAEFDRLSERIGLMAAGGIRLSTLVNSDPPGPPGQPVPNGGLRFGHFSREMPIARQIANMIRNLSQVATFAAREGIVLAFENHMDYRISEIVQVVEGVDSPFLRINYDYANSFSVVEDQLDAAHMAAPYTAMTHFKDMRVQSITTTGEPRFYHAPIRYGSVEILEILEVFQRNTPNPVYMPQCIETCCLPQYDPQLWMKLNIEWLEQNAAKYFPNRFPQRAHSEGSHSTPAAAKLGRAAVV